MTGVNLYSGLDIRILQIYSYYQASRLQQGERPPPKRRFFTILCWLLALGWWLTLLLTIIAWVFVASGIGGHLGMRLLGLAPIAGFLEPPDLAYEASTIGVASSLKAGDLEQVHPGLRLAYAVMIGWWVSAVVLVLAWLMMITIVGIPVARRLYVRVPRLATLAVYTADRQDARKVTARSSEG